MALFAAFFVLAIAASLCQAAPVEEPVPNKLLELAHAVDSFGQNLLQRLELDEVNAHRDSPKNVLISPLSISSVLTTLLGGAASDTHTQLNETLGFSSEHLTEQEAISFFADLRIDLNRQAKNTENVLTVADAVALQKGYPVLDSFQSVLNGELMMVKDFAHESKQATKEINDWVSLSTNGKIPKLFEQDIDYSTVMVLLNAIYFKGSWKMPFETKNTIKSSFSFPGKSGKEAELVDMMYAGAYFAYAHFDDGDMLEMPYANDSFSMLFFLPKEGAVQTTVSGLFGATTTKLSERVTQLRTRIVKVHIPKFKVEASYSLNQALTSLGIKDAFLSGKADFSRINGKHDLLISEVVHKATIEVNEEGAEASAATGVGIHPASVEIPVEFNANRPFLFTIYDKQYQLALFTGVINKP